MDDVENQLNKLESDEEYFESEFDKLKEFYILMNPEEIYSFINRNKRLILMLNGVLPIMDSKFSDADYYLKFHQDKSGEGGHTLVIYVRVDEETRKNGFYKTIREIGRIMHPLRLKFHVLSEFDVFSCHLPKKSVEKS